MTQDQRKIERQTERYTHAEISFRQTEGQCLNKGKNRQRHVKNRKWYFLEESEI